MRISFLSSVLFLVLIFWTSGLGAQSVSKDTAAISQRLVELVRQIEALKEKHDEILAQQVETLATIRILKIQVRR